MTLPDRSDRALPLNEREIDMVAKSTLYSCLGGCHFDDATAMSAMTLAAATLIHHAAKNADVYRADLMDHFFEGLVAVVNNIDANGR